MPPLSTALARHRELGPEFRSTRALKGHFAPVPAASLRALLCQMGPFVPSHDAFRFSNGDSGGWAITEADAPAIRSRFSAAITPVAEAGLSSLRSALLAFPVPLPEAAVEEVVHSVRGAFVSAVTDLVIGVIPGRYGRCGGMAFAGLDLFLAGLPVDESLGTAPPDGGPLRDYIFRRLLDSLDDNAGTFFQWAADLYALPVMSRLATAALGAGVGSVAGALGTAIGAYIGGSVDVLHLGGPRLLNVHTAENLRLLCKRLDLFPAWPIGLVYGDSANPIDQHQILALSYADGGTGVLRLDVWDNNHRNTADAWTIDGSSESLSVVGPSRPVRGIICERYKRAIPPPALHLSPT